jgi:hypothetical protein
MRLGNPRNLGNEEAVLIEGSAARLIIQKSSSRDWWQVLWQITHSPTDRISGQVMLSTFELEAAFGLREHIDPGAESLIALFGGSSAYQGKFIRWAHWLNLPCPGTGMDGDPNVSIELRPDIQGGIKKLIADQQP